MGESTVSLQKTQGQWRLDSTVRGTHGLASLLGFKRKETTIFEWEPQSDHAPWQPLNYQFSQKVAFKKKTSRYQYHKDTSLATGHSGKKKWEQPVKPGFITPNLVVLALARDICSGKKDMRYRVLDKGRLKTYHFLVVGTENGLIKVVKRHSTAERVTESWHDPTRECLNVRSRHKEPDGDWIETTLLNSTFSATPEKSVMSGNKRSP